MKRREFMKSSALAAAALAGGRLLGAERRPNVMLIIVDQWRQPCWFPERAELPGFDRLRREGLSFTNHFVSAVPCSPSRACLFTGLHLTQHGVQNNIDVSDYPSMDPRIPTVAHRFQEAGYRTPYFGKWHLTKLQDYATAGLSAYGFEDWHGPDHDGTPLDGTDNDPRFARQAVTWLNLHGRNQNKPWFLTCSIINPHDICYYHRLDVPSAVVPRVADRLPDNFHDDLTGKPRVQAIYRDGYGRLMGSTPDKPKEFWLRYLDYYLYFQRLADNGIRRLLATLDRLQLADDTIVVFTSDHGDMCGSHQLQAKGPFVYQENNNVPLVFRWPGQIPAGAACAALNHNPDVFPTLTELCGLPAPVDHLAGKSLAPLLRNPGADPVRDHVLMGFGMKGGGLMTSIARGLGISTMGLSINLRGIYDGRYKYARYFDPGVESEFELYDRHEDPLELRNLAADPAAAALGREMADRLAEAEAKEMAPVPPEQLYRKA
jgi:arylsulfatase